MTRMEKYIRDHPFFAQQSVFKFSTTQRRSFERDVYDHARGLNYSKANAKKQVVTARHLCGEKDYDSDDSRLGNEVDDSEAVLLKKPGYLSIQGSEVPNGGITMKRKLESTNDVASEDERPSKKSKKGKSLKQAETENKIPLTLDKKTEAAEFSKVSNLRIRVIRSVVTAMVDIIQRHTACSCDSREFISNDPRIIDDEHGQQSIAPLMRKKEWLRLRKKLLRQINSPPLRNDNIPNYKASMPLIQNKTKMKNRFMKAWRVALSHGARDEYERSFHDIVGGPDDFDELLRLAPANEDTLEDKADAVNAEQYVGVAEIRPEIPAKKPKKRKSKKAKKMEKRLKDMNLEKGILIDPSIEPWNSIGVHEVQQASLGEGSSKSYESAATKVRPTGTVENETALADAKKALAEAEKAKRKASRRERREHDRQKLKEASTNAVDPKLELISHNQEDELSDLADIINGLHDASLKQEEPHDIIEKPSEQTIQHEDPNNHQSTSITRQGNLRLDPREVIEISSNSPSPPPEQPKKWTKDQEHKALQADTWLMYTGESADGFPDRLEATFKDLERKKGFRFTYEGQLRIQDMLQANYGDSYSGDELQDQILDRIAAIQSRDEMIPPIPKKSKGKGKEKSRAKSVSRKSGFQFPMIR